MVARLPSSNDAQDDMTSQFPHASPVSMETDDMELEASTLAEQRNAVDSPNGHQDANLIREAQLNAHNINARLQDLSPEQAKLFLNTLSKNLWREDKQDDFSKGSTTKKSINILVLGQTGVGKSTWINALVNYLTYKTLDEAIAAKAPICVIPTKFTMYDNNHQRHDVHLGGAHDNEVFADNGQSATQSAKTYMYEQDEHNIYIIDTPGMNDTRGHLKDEENIQNILRSIAPFKEIHAICFLFKANEARLTESFRYSIEKWLGNFSKTVLNNACFVFTNARGTFYRPGDTMGPLKAYFNELKEKEGLSVRIDDSNIFCLDNEAFRFVCAHFSDIQFDTREIKTFADSWKHSSNEVQRLLDHAARARPHNTSDTLSINETRTWIYQLIDPILKACTMIQRNLQQLDWQWVSAGVSGLKKRMKSFFGGSPK